MHRQGNSCSAWAWDHRKRCAQNGHTLPGRRQYGTHYHLCHHYVRPGPSPSRRQRHTTGQPHPLIQSVARAATGVTGRSGGILAALAQTVPSGVPRMPSPPATGSCVADCNPDPGIQVIRKEVNRHKNPPRQMYCLRSKIHLRYVYHE
jgi:hypothetical protein